ncbi:MAG: hypothetical protein AB1553_14820 [Nitrospirota bacterium]
MRNKSLVALVMLLFTVSFAALGFAGDDITGQVVKVEGATVSVKQADGSITKAEAGGMDLKEGDTVTVKSGKVVKKDATAKKAKKKVMEGC